MGQSSFTRMNSPVSFFYQSKTRSLKRSKIFFWPNEQRLRLEQLLRIFRALQTSRVLHVSMKHADVWTNCWIYYKVFAKKCKINTYQKVTHILSFSLFYQWSSLHCRGRGLELKPFLRPYKVWAVSPSKISNKRRVYKKDKIYYALRLHQNIDLWSLCSFFRIIKSGVLYRDPAWLNNNLIRPLTQFNRTLAQWLHLTATTTMHFGCCSQITLLCKCPIYNFSTISPFNYIL